MAEQSKQSVPKVVITWIGAVAILSFDAPPVNALSVELFERLSKGLAAINAADPSAVVIISDGAHFSAGKDMAEFDGLEEQPSLVDFQAAIESCKVPVIAAIEGAAMGAGLDLALTAHYRIAGEGARFALPEVLLGIAGGSQRLLRAAGIEATLDIALSGREFGAHEALQLGVIDRIANGPLREGAVDFARFVVDQALPLRLLRNEGQLLPEAAEGREQLRTYLAKNATRFRGQVAPAAIVRALEAGVTLPFDDAVAEEYRLCAELMLSPQAKAQQYYFSAERLAGTIPDIPRCQELRQVRTVGVVGAGLMGGGIAMAFAGAGYRVTMVDRSAEMIERGLTTIGGNYNRIAARGAITAEEVKQRLGRITPGTGMTALSDCDLVIEAVFEQMDIKKAIFAELGSICRPGAVMATNTSGLDVNEIAQASGRPGDVIGLHFFSPAHIMKLVEVVRGEQTARDVVATAMRISRIIGKIPVLVGVCPGFVGNRMLIARQDEASRMLLEGVAPWDIDRAMVDFGFPMGPFAMADMAGLDIGWDEAKSNGATIQDRLCEKGRRGQKTSAGYYDYDESRRASPSQIVSELIAEFRRQAGQVASESLSDNEIVNRCLGLMINEGAKILAERIAIRASDIDVIYVNGYGWPKHRGGPMYYADQIGLGALCDRLDEMASRLGERFEPAPLLRKLAGEGRSFADFDKRTVDS